jgi:hypothetical protein
MFALICGKNWMNALAPAVRADREIRRLLLATSLPMVVI